MNIVSKKTIPEPAHEFDLFALLLAAATVIASVFTYATVRDSNVSFIEGLPLLAACVWSILYSVLIYLLCMRTKAANDRTKRLEAMLEALLERDNKTQ